MDEIRPKKKRRIWWLLLPAALLAAGILALILLLGNSGVSARYDNAEAILAAYDPAGFDGMTLEPDGTAVLRLDREDLYWFADQYGLLEELREELRARDETADVGFRISNGQLTVYLRSRLLGFLPVSYRAELGVGLEPSGRELRLWVSRVSLGRRVPLPENLWPAMLDEDMRVRLPDITETVRSLYLEEDALVLELDGLQTPMAGALRPDEELLYAMAFFGADAGVIPEVQELLDAADGGDLPVAEAQALAVASGRAETVLAELMARCAPASLTALWDGEGDSLRKELWQSLARRAAARREALEQALAGEQAKYERLLFAVREMYRSGAVRIGETGLVNAAGEPVDPSTLSRLPVTPTDSRIVFLLSESGSPEISCEDMPALGTVPRVDWRTALLADAELVPDLGVVLTTGGGVPALLHRRQDGTLVLREITEELYVSVLVSRGIPTVDMDALPSPAGEVRRPAGEGWTGAALLPLPAEE